MRLSEWLANSGTSQSELARRLGVTQGRVSQLVAGALPSLDLANKIAAATGNKVRPADFGDQTMANEQKLDTVEDAIKAVAAGEMVVVVDDDDRENEGDLIGAAAKITPEQMAFMVRHTSGIRCASPFSKAAQAAISPSNFKSCAGKPSISSTTTLRSCAFTAEPSHSWTTMAIAGRVPNSASG